MLYPIEATGNQGRPSSASSPSEGKISPSVASTTSRVPVEDTMLPMTNLTVSQYISELGQVNTFSTTVLSLNSSHWFTYSEYANTSVIPSTFDSTISRESTNHYYPYFVDFFWDPSDEHYDFWIDPTGFSKDYVFPVSG